MMDIDNLTTHQANSQDSASGLISVAPPTCDMLADGQSVENIPLPTRIRTQRDNSHHWFVVRATHGRAKQVYEEIIGLHSPDIEAYLPAYHYETMKIVNGLPEKVVDEGVLHHGMVFIRSTHDEYSKLVRAQEPYPFIQGLTPYYDHFHERETGRNDYLIVPDYQFRNFRTLLESGDTHILVDQEAMPSYLHGKKVEIISGSFAGITGTMLRWKGLRRVFIRLEGIGTFGTGFIRNCDFRLMDETDTTLK